MRFYSAERGDWEELPAALVHWAATEKWAKEHVPGAAPAASPASPEAAAVDKEEQQERAEQNARTPEVAPGLRLPDEQGVWALDTFHDQPELVAVVQNSGNVNQQTGHNVLRSALNPMGGMKQPIELPGSYSKVRLHVDQPAIYVSLSTDNNDLTDSEPGCLTVDTHGADSTDSAKEKNSYSSPGSQYAIVRVWNNLRRDYRVVSATQIGMTGKVSQTEDIIPTVSQIPAGKALDEADSAAAVVDWRLCTDGDSRSRRSKRLGLGFPRRSAGSGQQERDYPTRTLLTIVMRAGRLKHFHFRRKAAVRKPG